MCFAKTKPLYFSPLAGNQAELPARPSRGIIVIRPFDNSQRACAFRYYARMYRAFEIMLWKGAPREQLCPREVIGVPALLENPPKIELVGPT